MSAPSADDPMTGEVLLDRYAVGEEIARGGFATVYRARHLELDVPVALKVLHARDGDSSAREAWLSAFRREARVLATLHHPAIVRVYDAGILERGGTTRAWMALEWLDGVTLDDDLRARGGEGRSPREAFELLRPAFDALALVHEAGVSHRDVKPSNVMLVKSGRGSAALRVIDFGIAKADDTLGPSSGATATGASLVAFSAAWAAPEQVTRTRTGPWTDVHALALLLTEVLTGQRPYGDASGPAVIEAILRTERPTPSRAGVEVGPWEHVLARALSRLPSDRPQNAAALWAELASCVEEAQAAWAANPPVRRVAPASRAVETLVPTAGTSAPAPPGAPVPEPPPSPAPAEPSTPSPQAVAPRRSAGTLTAAAVVAVALVAFAIGRRGETPAAPRPATTRVVDAPPPRDTPTVAPEAPAAMAPDASAMSQLAAPSVARAGAARTRPPPRRMARAPVTHDAGATTTRTEPRLIIE